MDIDRSKCWFLLKHYFFVGYVRKAGIRASSHFLDAKDLNTLMTITHQNFFWGLAFLPYSPNIFCYEHGKKVGILKCVLLINMLGFKVLILPSASC